jgi:hypothetical protein
MARRRRKRVGKVRARAWRGGRVAGGEPANELDRVLARTLAGKRVLLVYGLMGEVLAAMRPFGVDYMATQSIWLRRVLGADTAVVRLPTGGAVADNALRLRAALLADPRPAVLIGHSKGGLEALATLMDPEAAARCCAFIAIQSPFFGSPVADALVAASPLHLTASGALRLLRTGSGAGLRDLTSKARLDWSKRNEAHLATLLGKIPVVCCATYLDNKMVGPDRRYLHLARWLERRGCGRNDGLVPVASALLPGTRQLVVPAAHRATVGAGHGRDPIGLLRRLLAMALLEDSAAKPAA